MFKLRFVNWSINEHYDDDDDDGGGGVGGPVDTSMQNLWIALIINARSNVTKTHKYAS